MPVAFSSLDQRLSRHIRELHDYLWVPDWKGNEVALRENLLKGARELDVFLSARGRLRKNAVALAKPWSREHQGASLFELLYDILGLTAATELARKGKHRDAATRTQAIIESTSIGVCSAAGHFEIVEEWEGRKIDFETYTTQLADVLQAKLIPQAGQFKRVLNAVYEFGSDWDGSASKEAQALAARAAVGDAAWCVSRSLTIRSLLGDSQRAPEKDFETLLQLIVARL
ncbi:MAG: hypothetical protein ACREDF_04955 [Thermoplasmata archaeon]